MIAKILIIVILLNALVVVAAFSSHISRYLKDIFIEPLYALASVGIIVLALAMFAMVKQNA